VVRLAGGNPQCEPARPRAASEGGAFGQQVVVLLILAASLCAGPADEPQASPLDDTRGGEQTLVGAQ
jgi:hypothetical protein